MVSLRAASGARLVARRPICLRLPRAAESVASRSWRGQKADGGDATRAANIISPCEAGKLSLAGAILARICFAHFAISLLWPPSVAAAVAAVGPTGEWSY